ncbi:hypothetical protein BU17DRAFT_98061 [Hysterangium stoloniferum]|nr:hypothetical protein BU17DRAFT_98061 [Hysterangium stoloniferum]
MPISSKINRGILSLPGATAASKATAERLLKTDEESHHCYFRPAGLHNHLSHHVLTAYDLGAPASLLEAIYDKEAKIQRPIDLNENGVVPEGTPNPGDINDENWVKWLGNAKAYQALVAFFSGKISDMGARKAVEQYFFSSAPNENGAHMLTRLCNGALHPFIQVGFGLEFDLEIEVAAGLAQAAVHGVNDDQIHPSLERFIDANIVLNAELPHKGRQPRTGSSILYLLRQIYDSPELVPVLPYEPDALLSKRRRDLGATRLAELHRILGQFDPGDTHEALAGRVEELIFAVTLLTFGSGKPNRKPRLDFFLMHLLTSSLFLPSYLKYFPSIKHQKALFRRYLQEWGEVLMLRGRPRIDATLVMSYTDNPIPPSRPPPLAHPESLAANGRNPWPAMIEDALHAPDSHTLKSLRALLYGATRYGTLAKGEIIGAWGPDGKETHPGISQVDGSIFVRAAGVLMDILGWVTHGQQPGNWDRSALGWDDAWKLEDREL